MREVTTIGLDIAKSVFQVHGIDAEGTVIIRRQLNRRYVLAFFQKLPPCLVGLEACASSRHRSRELKALGHAVRLMPPAYVKPYVKRQKNDAADAEAICEAVTRPTMRFVETKTPEPSHASSANRRVDRAAFSYSDAFNGRRALEPRGHSRPGLAAALLPRCPLRAGSGRSALGRSPRGSGRSAGMC